MKRQDILEELNRNLEIEYYHYWNAVHGGAPDEMIPEAHKQRIKAMIAFARGLLGWREFDRIAEVEEIAEKNGWASARKNFVNVEG